MVPGMIDPLYSVSGFGVGILVGMTGVGGGSLMTPLLIVLFGIHPASAVGTDLLFAASTKAVGTLVHARGRTVEWRIVARMMAGSIPAAAVTLLILHGLDLRADAVSRLITPVLAVATLATAVLLLAQDWLLARASRHPGLTGTGSHPALTVAAGAVLGVLVPISSVGAGALGVPALILLYPRLSLPRIVGSDIAHAIPLTLVSGLAYLVMGAVNWTLLASLLCGSVPGIVLGSLLASRVPRRVLRYVLAAVLAVASVKLLV